MPPKVKVTKQMILDAAFQIVRFEGCEGLSARRIAEALACSTQPILYQYRTVNEIRAEVYRVADEYHSSFILPKENEKNPFLAIGLNYVRFGYEEKNLFRFLFQSNQFEGQNLSSLITDPSAVPLINILTEAVGCTTKMARELFVTFFVAVHGYASLLANNAMEYHEAECKIILKHLFNGLSTCQGEEIL